MTIYGCQDEISRGSAAQADGSSYRRKAVARNHGEPMAPPVLNWRGSRPSHQCASVRPRRLTALLHPYHRSSPEVRRADFTDLRCSVLHAPVWRVPSGTRLPRGGVASLREQNHERSIAWPRRGAGRRSASREDRLVVRRSAGCLGPASFDELLGRHGAHRTVDPPAGVGVVLGLSGLIRKYATPRVVTGGWARTQDRRCSGAALRSEDAAQRRRGPLECRAFTVGTT